MPRSVTLSTGKVITQVPDDVTNEEVEAQYVRKRVERPEPELEEVKDTPVEREGVGFDFRKVLARTQANVLGTGIDVLSSFAPKEEREIIQKFSGQMGAALATQGQPDLLDPETGKVKATTTVAGNIAEVVPYLAVGSRVATTKAIAQTPRIVQGALSGMFTDQLLADEDENLFNFLEEEFPESTVADISAYLATNEDDSEAEKRLKLVGEGLALGALVDISIAGGKGAINIYSKARSMFNKNAKDLTPEERGEVFVDYLKDSKERAGLQKREDQIEFNETAEGAAQVQQQQSSRLNRVFRQLFTSRGYFTPKAQSAFDDAQYAQRSAVSRAEHIATRLTTAMDEMAKNSDVDISDKVQEVLTDPKLKNLSRSDRKLALRDVEEEFGFSTEVAEEVLNARELIDDLSTEITGSSSIPLEIKELVNENIGSYLRRSYRLFEDTGFKPSEDVVNDTREYLVQQAMDKTQGAIDIDDAYRQAEIQINNILDQGGFADRNAAGDYFVKSRRINGEILAGKKEIPPEIRTLMGEIENPSDNIVLTISKMSRFVETSKFYSNLNRLGTQGKYIFDADNAPVDLIKDANKITGTNSVLDGKYTTPEILTAIKQNESFLSAPQSEGIMANAYRSFLSLKGSSQAAKTVFSVTTQSRNLLGGLQFGTANGLKPYEFSGAGTVLKNQLLKGQDITLDDLYEKYLRLGVINTNVKVGEFRSLMESDRDTLIDPSKLRDKLGKLGEYGGKVVDTVEDVYVATDDLFKISAYNQELDTLKKAFPDRGLATLEEEAANVIRNTLPNYDRVPKGIKSLRNAPLGSFVSFPAEIIRTSGNIIRQASREINSGNSTLKARGIERLGGFAVTNGAFYAAGAATAKLAGLTEEEREAAQTLTETPWSKDAPKLFLRIDGKLFTSDTQFLDSYSVIKEPIMAAYREIREGSLQGESLDKYLADASLSAVGTLVRPYVDETILTKAITDVGFALKGNGRTPEGKALFTTDMTTAEKVTATPYHILKAFEPGVVDQVKNLYEAGVDIPDIYTGKNKLPSTELVAMLGVRFKELDPADSIRFAISDYNEDNRNLQSVFVNYRTTQDQIVGDYVNREKALYRNAQELSKKIEASIDLIGKGKTAQYLKEGNLSNKTIAQFLGGRYMPTQISTDLIRNAYEKMQFGPGESVGSTVKEIVRQYADMVGTRLEKPKEDSPLRRTLFAIGGEVYDVPNAPEEPDERIDRLTGLPYNQQAGGAFIDEGERVEFAGGALVKPIARFVRAALGEAVDKVASQGENIPFNRLVKRLQTQGVRTDEIQASDIMNLIDEKDIVTTRAGNKAVTPEGLRNAEARRTDVFKQEEGTYLQAQEEVGEVAEGLEREVGALEDDMAMMDDPYEEDMLPDDLDRFDPEAEDPTFNYADNLLDTAVDPEKPLIDRTNAVREIERVLNNSPAELKEMYSEVVPEDAALNTYRVTYYSDPRVSRPTESSHFVAGRDYPMDFNLAYHTRGDVVSGDKAVTGGKAARVFEIQSDVRVEDRYRISDEKVDINVWKNAIHNEIVKAKEEGMDEIQFLIYDDFPDTEALTNDINLNDEQTLFMKRSPEIQKAYQTIVNPLVRKTAKKIGASVQERGKYLALVLPATFTLPLYAQEEEDLSAVATDISLGMELDEALVVNRDNFAEGGVFKRIFNKTLEAGAKALGFGAEQQRAHEKEVVRLVNQFAEQGLIPERSMIPTDEAGFGKFGAGADEEAFNAFNHAYLVYKHGSTLKDPLLQAKEIGQSFFRENPNTEKLDMVNNAYGANLRDRAENEEDAKAKLALAYYNTSKKLAEGKPLIYGEDLVFNVNDLDKVESGSFAYNLR